MNLEKNKWSHSIKNVNATKKYVDIIYKLLLAWNHVPEIEKKNVRENFKKSLYNI